ncbi:MAG TPA: Rv3235 family protein [Beutenbergiaceae bacterium]|nr:Rv3235 family protein [Beutenbergiaceae bacterium]
MTTTLTRTRKPQPRPLPRSSPRVQWDPLAVDVEGTPPVDSLPPPLTEATPAPGHEVVTVAAMVTKAIGEVLLGSRSVHQVQRWVIEDIWHVIRRRAALTQRTYPPQQQTAPTVTILRVHPCRVNDHRWEASVVFHDGLRVRCAAIQLAWHRLRWRLSALKIG